MGKVPISSPGVDDRSPLYPTCITADIGIDETTAVVRFALAQAKLSTYGSKAVFFYIAKMPALQRILTQEAYIYLTLSFKSNPFKMSLTTLTRYWLPGQTLESLSKLGAGVLVLVTSLVSFHPQAYI